jgi:hypothetical protein
MAGVIGDHQQLWMLFVNFGKAATGDFQADVKLKYYIFQENRPI